MASNLKDCFTRLQSSQRYIDAYEGKEIASKEADYSAEDFETFRKYVRLLRSCTIMCNSELSSEYKKLFIDFFSGTRLELAKDYGASKD